MNRFKKFFSFKKNSNKQKKNTVKPKQENNSKNKKTKKSLSKRLKGLFVTKPYKSIENLKRNLNTLQTLEKKGITRKIKKNQNRIVKKLAKTENNKLKSIVSNLKNNNSKKKIKEYIGMYYNSKSNELIRKIFPSNKSNNNKSHQNRENNVTVKRPLTPAERQNVSSEVSKVLKQINKNTTKPVKFEKSQNFNSKKISNNNISNNNIPNNNISNNNIPNNNISNNNISNNNIFLNPK
jgi:hypothetical protein